MRAGSRRSTASNLVPILKLFSPLCSWLKKDESIRRDSMSRRWLSVVIDLQSVVIDLQSVVDKVK